VTAPDHGRSARRRLVRRLLSEADVTNQRQLAELLAAEGFAVTQATVSRDLDALGAVRAKSEGNGLRYEILDDRFTFKPGTGSAMRAINQFVQSVSASGNLVVIRTPPGAAHLVASAIDGAGLEAVLGTVAGDDTILIVAAESAGGARLAEILQNMGEG